MQIIDHLTAVLLPSRRSLMIPALSAVPPVACCLSLHYATTPRKIDEGPRFRRRERERDYIALASQQV